VLGFDALGALALGEADAIAAGQLAATEAGDTASFVVAGAAAVGSLDASEAPDAAAFVGQAEQLPFVISLPGSRHREPLPVLVEGYGDGELPRLQGEAHGEVLSPRKDEPLDDLELALLLLVAA
jgi:hypothetical protein